MTTQDWQFETKFYQLARAAIAQGYITPAERDQLAANPAAVAVAKAAAGDALAMHQVQYAPELAWTWAARADKLARLVLYRALERFVKSQPAAAGSDVLRLGVN
jgi:hypothetical protein